MHKYVCVRVCVCACVRVCLCSDLDTTEEQSLLLPPLIRLQLLPLLLLLLLPSSSPTSFFRQERCNFFSVQLGLAELLCTPFLCSSRCLCPHGWGSEALGLPSSAGLPRRSISTSTALVRAENQRESNSLF